MSIIKIVAVKIDNVYMKVTCQNDKAIERSMGEYFSVYTDNYQHSKLYKEGKWDGKEKLYPLNTKKMYLGLMPYLRKYCADKKYLLEEKGFDVPEDVNNINKKPFDHGLVKLPDFIESRTYQEESINKFIEQEKLLLLSPTSSGKSYIIYMVIRHMLSLPMVANSNKKILLVVPTVGLCKQMVKDFGDYSKQDDSFDVESIIHVIHQGKEKYDIDPNKKIIISTYQSIYKEDKSWFNDYASVIVDEAHKAKAQSIKTILERCVNASWRLGTTGTIDDLKLHKLVLEGLLGKIHKVISTHELIEDGTCASFDIDVIKLQHNNIDKTIKRRLKYNEEIDFLMSLEKRNQFIIDLANKLKGNTLILFKLVEGHGEVLYKMLQEQNNNNKSISFVSGKIDPEEREEIRIKTESMTDSIIVASLGTFSTGINIKKLNNVIIAAPIKSKITLLQSIGRVLRQSPDGRPSKLYDIVDDLGKHTNMIYYKTELKDKRNYTLRHGDERQKLYDNEKFKYTIHRIDL